MVTSNRSWYWEPGANPPGMVVKGLEKQEILSTCSLVFGAVG